VVIVRMHFYFYSPTIKASRKCVALPLWYRSEIKSVCVPRTESNRFDYPEQIPLKTHTPHTPLQCWTHWIIGVRNLRPKMRFRCDLHFCALCKITTLQGVRGLPRTYYKNWLTLSELSFSDAHFNPATNLLQTHLSSAFWACHEFITFLLKWPKPGCHEFITFLLKWPKPACHEFITFLLKWLKPGCHEFITNEA
jgi:hypothetical protein